MKDNSPLVSVIITTHNRCSLLPRAIRSVLDQTFQDFELIIVNDGSTDNTEKTIEEYLERSGKIRYLKNEYSLGGNAARNRGILAAKGEFIAGLDDDDEFLNNRLQLLIENYEETYSIITSRSILIRNKGRKKTKHTPKVDLKTLLYFNVIGNQVLVKREVILKAGLFDEDLKRYQDYDMWVRIVELFGPAKILTEVTQIIHWNHNLASNNSYLNNLMGGIQFYNKHKSKMSKGQRKMQLYIIRKKLGKKNSVKMSILLLTGHNYKSVLREFLSPI